MSTPLNASVLKAFAILRLFTSQRTEITASSVASELGMTPATAHRFLITLLEAGVLYSDRRGSFRLSQSIEALGRLAKAANPLPAQLQPVLAALARDLNESIMACQLGAKGPTCIAVARSDQPISVNIDVSTVLPIASTAQGKVFLSEMKDDARMNWLQGQVLPAGLAKVRSAGFAYNLGDNEPDIAAVSVPVHDTEGAIALTISAFGMLSRFDPDFLAVAVSALKLAATQIEHIIDKN